MEGQVVEIGLQATMCSGAVDAVFVLKSLLERSDGVLIGGCHPGDEHYQDGDHKAQ